MRTRKQAWARSAVLLGIFARAAVAEESGQSGMDTLRRANLAELATFTLRIEMEKEVSWVLRDQGRFTQTCTVSRGPEGTAIICQTDHQPVPAYRPSGYGNYTPGRYDFSGNLYISIPQMHAALWSESRNEGYQEDGSFSVDPNGAVTFHGLMRGLNRYRATDLYDWGRGELRQIWWALGQGIASGFQRTTNELSEADGRQRLLIRGTSNHGTLEGQWDVIVDPSAEHLIRSASFQLDLLESSPGVEIETKGLRRFGAWAFPEEGVVRSKLASSNEELVKKVSLLDFTPEPDEALFERVSAILDNAASNGELAVFDYRDDPSRPVVTHERP